MSTLTPVYLEQSETDLACWYIRDCNTQEVLHIEVSGRGWAYEACKDLHYQVVYELWPRRIPMNQGNPLIQAQVDRGELVILYHNEPVPLALFSKDHWSLLGYVDTCCASQRALERRHLRINPGIHPLLAHRSDWRATWGTQLANGVRLPQHDDIQCLEDLECYGFVEIISSVNGIVRLSKLGETAALALRAHKQKGGKFADFKP